MDGEGWSANLRYLCGFYPSVSEVCRRLGINRQQFAKYLNGRVRPSPYNLRRICSFFGISETELDTPPERFAERVDTARGAPRPRAATRDPLAIYDSLVARTAGTLDRYVGFYFRYFHSFGYPGRIIRALAVLRREGDRYAWRTVEVVASPRTASRRTVAKYHGVAFCLGDRIFILEHEILLGLSVTQLILHPSYENPITYLTGVHTGAPRLRGRNPTASTVLLEYLGPEVDLRAALRECGLYPEDGGAIGPAIMERIRNNRGGHGHVLEAEEM